MRERSVLSANQKFRKATTKLQRLASLMSEEGMPVFLERMAFIDQLISHWEKKQVCTLVETVMNHTDNTTIDGEVIASCPMFPELIHEVTEEETSQEPGFVDELPMNEVQLPVDEVQLPDDEVQLPDNEVKAHQSTRGSVTETGDPSMNSIDLSNVLLPVKARDQREAKRCS